MRNWLKANGGAPALIIVGLGLAFAYWPLGVLFIAVGMMMVVYGWKRFPFMLVRKTSAQAVAQSDAAIAALARYQLEQLGALLGQHVRYAPSPGVADPEAHRDPHAAWARGVARSSTHDQTTVGRFFEEHYSGLMGVLAQLHARGVITDEELKNVNWSIGTMTIGSGSLHGLERIPPLLASALARLQSGSAGVGSTVFPPQRTPG